MAAKKEAIIEIKPLKMKDVRIKIVGDTPLIMHCWSEKAMRQLLESMTGNGNVKQREKKNPVDDFIWSMYWMSPPPAQSTMEAFEETIANGARFGFPAVSIKSAAASGVFRSKMVKDKVSIYGSFFINGIKMGNQELVEIMSDAPIMREDLVRVSNGAPDLRYRGEFNNWSIDLPIRYNEGGQYSIEQIVNMINIGGTTVGIGEWRPEKRGQYGMFHVE